MKRSALWIATAALVVMMAAPAAADTFTIDPVHSVLLFRIKHFGVGMVWGRINDAAGTFVFNPDDPARNAVTLTAMVENIDTNNTKRDAHLRSPEFFDVQKFPTITFKSREFKPIGDNRYRVTGDFTLKGVTRELTVEAIHIGSGRDPWTRYRAGFETTFTIRRSEFGMDAMLGGIGDEVQITVAIEGIKDY